jgi:virulence factor Mce-like protein
MRSRFVWLVSAAALVVALVVWLGGGAAGYRAAAVFDSAKGIVPGQLVKIAGARVGTVTAVRLVPGPRALIEFSVDRRFAPFHADARCRILPEGLISENYVECDPGSPSSPVLGAAGRDGLPTVPVAHTTVPVSLQDVLNIFSLPVSERLGSLIDELGIGTAGRGTDIAAILRRVNPALTQGDRVLAILDRQTAQISGAVTQMRSVMGALAARSTSVRSFVDHAASVASVVAAHGAALQAGVARLPGLLERLDHGLAPIDRVAVQGTPLLVDLQAAAPGLLRLTRVLPAFVVAGGPAVTALGQATGRGIGTLRVARPLVDQLARLAPVARSVLPSLDRLLVSSRDSGAFEGLRLLYSLATDSGGYDATSHYVTALIVPFPSCLSDPALAGCSHAYSAPAQGSIPINGSGAGPVAGAIRSRAAHRPRSAGHRAGAGRGSGAPGLLGGSTGSGGSGHGGPPGPVPVPSLPKLESSLRPLLSYLLR